MTPVRHALSVTLGLSFVGLAALWLTRGPAASLATYLVLAALVCTVTVISVNVFRNANPARPMGRLIHDEDRAALGGRVSRPD